MSIYEDVRSQVKKTLNILFPDIEIDCDKVVVEPIKDKAHGDIATNAAMVLSKQLKLNPKVLAEKLIAQLEKNNFFKNIVCAGPGFINFTIHDAMWIKELNLILDKKEDYGFSLKNKGQSVNVEFVSANPTGPLHTGHGRNAVLGDVVAFLLEKTGYNVTREYYINDAGGQVDTLAKSVYLRYMESCGQKTTKEDYVGKYPGDYLIEIGENLKSEFGDKFVNTKESEWLNLFKEKAIAAMMNEIKNNLKDLDIQMDVFTSEKSLSEHAMTEKVLKKLEEKGDIYEGVLTPPKGHTIDDWEERPQTLFRSTKYGDDVDRALKKSNGAWTYFAGDLGYHLDKIDRKFNRLVNLFGADHIGYVKRLKSAVYALSENKIIFDIKTSQLVNFLDNGEPVRMSKRSGNFITLKDVIDRVGKDATRFMMVSRHQDVCIDFDFAKVIESTKDNPIFYIQYAHARIHSVLRHAKSLSITVNQDETVDFSYIKDEAEKSLIKLMAQWPRQVEIAAETLEPHRICTYLYDMASHFHALWNLGKENTQLRFIDENNKNLTKARLQLIWAVAIVIRSGLNLLRIKPLEEM